MPDPKPLSAVIDDPVAGYWGLATKGAKATCPAHVVRNGDVGKDGRIPISSLPIRYFTSHELTKAEVLREDAILVSSGAYTGNVGRIVGRTNDLPVIASNFVRRLRARTEFDSGWLFQLLRSEQVQRYVWPHTGGSAIPNLGSSFYAGCPVGFVPPLPEQRRIAEILDTLDEAIRRTEEIIAKLKQVKQGLLHDLLTRGIDDNGELRDPDRHPEQFKDSPLGRIPKAWEVSSIERLLADVVPAMRSGPFGSALLKSELVEDGVPLLGIDNVHVERFVDEFRRFVTSKKAAELSRYRVRPRDVMITIMGTVGRCCLVPDELEHALSTKHVWTLTFDQERYSPFLACLQINHSPWVLRHFGRDEQGGIMSAIRSETLRTVLLPVPPLREQAQIEGTLRTLVERIASEQDAAAKMKLEKQGLMEDLLTGRVRVTALLEEAAR